MDVNDWLGDGPESGGGGSVAEAARNIVLQTNRDGWDSLLREVCDANAQTLNTRIRQTVTEWAEGDPDDDQTGAHIPAQAGQPKPGRYRRENGPVMVAVQDAFSDRRVSEITMVIAAQVGKSRSMQNMIGWAIVNAPGPMTIAYPDEATAQTKMEEDFLPSVWATPSLSPLVAPDEKVGQRDKGRKGRFTAPGMWIRFVSTRSAVGVKGSPAMYFFLEEHAASVVGAPINPDGLAAPRLTQFANGKLVRLSTPLGSAETCPTTHQYNLSDRQKPFVVCPKCKSDFLMDWDHVKAGNQPGKPRHLGSSYVCHNPQCQYEMNDGVRGLMLDAVQWRQTAIHECCGIEQDPIQTRNWDDEGTHRCTECYAPRSREHSGFWCSTLYAKGVELDKLVKRWFDSQGNPDLLREFRNQTLAIGFEPAGVFSRDIIKTLMDRQLDYQEIWGPDVLVPPGVRFLTMPVDVQRDRLEGVIRGYGFGEESWGIGHFKIWGDPNAPDAAVWRVLHAIRKHEYQGIDQRLYGITMCGIDIGDPETRKAAMRYVLPNMRDGVVPLRGERLGELFQPYDHTKKHDTPHHVVGTDAAKKLLDMRLRIQWAADEGPTTVKPGMMHWSRNAVRLNLEVENPETGEMQPVVVDLDYGEDYFDQVTNFQEVYRRNSRTGQRELRFAEADKAVREEGMDLENYANMLCQAIMKKFNVGYVDHVPEQWFKPTDLARRRNMAERGEQPKAMTKAEADDVARPQGRRYRFAPNPGEAARPDARKIETAGTGAANGFHVSRPGTRGGW